MSRMVLATSAGQSVKKVFCVRPCGVLVRRSQRAQLGWDRFYPLLNLRIPRPGILHPYPRARFGATVVHLAGKNALCVDAGSVLHAGEATACRNAIRNDLYEFDSTWLHLKLKRTATPPKYKTCGLGIQFDSRRPLHKP
jgi:hypothetical protein